MAGSGDITLGVVLSFWTLEPDVGGAALEGVLTAAVVGTTIVAGMVV